MSYSARSSRPGTTHKYGTASTKTVPAYAPTVDQPRLGMFAAHATAFTAPPAITAVSHNLPDNAVRHLKPGIPGSAQGGTKSILLRDKRILSYWLRAPATPNITLEGSRRLALIDATFHVKHVRTHRR